MSYELVFVESALKEWRKLATPIREQFKAKLQERLHNPHVQSARLHGMPDCYKIKLRSLGYRLVYRVDGNEVFVTVISIGRRERNEAYIAATERL